MCRSPMAEGIAKKHAHERNIKDIVFLSAGIGTIEGLPPSQNAIIACEEIGIDISEHRSRQLTEEILSECDIVFGMEGAHLEYVNKMLSGRKKRMFLLGGYIDGMRSEIEDPIGKELQEYRKTRDEIKREIIKLLENPERIK